MKTDSSHIAKGVMFGLLTALIWGAWPVFSRFSLTRALNTYDIAVLRFGVAGTILLPYWLKTLRHTTARPAVRPQLVLLMFFGAGAPYLVLSGYGLSIAPAGHFGVITPSCMLTFSSLAAWWLLDDKPTPARLIGWPLILIGVTLVGLRGLSLGSGDVWRGDLIFLICGVMWGIYTVAFKQTGMTGLQATAWVNVTSMLALIPIYLIFGLGNMGAASTSEIVTQGLFQGVFSAVIAMFCYNKALAILGVSRGAVFAALVPGCALILGIPVLGEIPGWIEVGGLCLVTTGMLFVLGMFGSMHRRQIAPGG
ncbi:DMT family transporter [Acanthopleuribacter pedis]|uniref:DMT family transporter n=1 Tax=Acanthopleuribacter pedis TaxID=442870 RepID=A0A8J7U6X0_9BACT|nr:DMT family transporter [Acanthopleuribacter pedis]MBO1322379.1 DMT family transporter [Acanthopleuribacter pedis]